MDRNLFLLDPLEIKMIQEINTIGEKGGFTLLQQDFCLKKVKDFSSSLPVDLVVLKDCQDGKDNNPQNGYQPLIDDLEDEARAIRKIIEEEHEKRRHPEECNNGYEVEEWPSHLPNYNNPNNFEPSFTQIDDENFLPNFSQLYDDSPYSDWCKASRGYDDRMEFLFEDRGTDTESGRLNNFALIQLDAKLGRIKWYLSRLTKGCSGCFKTNWSASTTGCYQVKSDDNGKVIRRTIYLLIDVIESIAKARGVARDEVIAEVYIHEMFHAYYDNIKRKKLVNAYLMGVTELEEPMAEFGMLVFMSQYKPSSLTAALSSVRDKLSCGDPNIQFYGLGAKLYDHWALSDPFDGEVLEVYQKIMPSPRLSIRLVNMYVHEARSTSFKPNKCLKMIHDIVDGFNRNIASIHKHYKYNGQEYGHTCRVIYDVLKSYAEQTGNPFNIMAKDFDNKNSIYGSYGIFVERKNITDNNANNYNLRQPIKLKDGTVIVVRGVWNNSKGGNAQTFFDQVKKLNKRGILPSSVDILA